MKFFYYVNELIEYHDTKQLNVKDADYKFVVVSMGIQMMSDGIGFLHFGFQIIIQQI